MALTPQDLLNAERDVADLGEFVNGDTAATVTNRAGDTFPSLRKALADGVVTGFGLGDSATKDVGDVAGTVAAGDDPRFAELDLKLDPDLGNVNQAALRRLSNKAAPVNNRVAFLGDSITRDSVVNGVIPGVDGFANAIRNMNRGMLHWLPFITRQRFVSDQSLVFGVSGETAQQIAARVGQVVASGAGTCVVIAGTNNVGTNDYAGTIAALTTIYQTLNDANILVLAYPILARQLAPGASASYGFMQRVNDWISRADERWANVRVMNDNSFFDVYDINGAPKPTFSWDGLHPSAIGMREIVRSAGDYLNTLLPEPGPTVRSNLDFWQSANNPAGYTNTNPLLGGSGGAKGANVTGQVADDWTVGFDIAGGSQGTMAAVCSKGVSPIDRVTQRIVLSGTGTGGFATTLGLTQPSFGATTFKAGDVIVAECPYYTAGGAVEVAGVALLLTTTQGGQTYLAYDGYPIVADAFTTDALRGTLRTPPMTLTQDATNASVALLIYIKNSISTARGIDVSVESISVRKVQP